MHIDVDLITGLETDGRFLLSLLWGSFIILVINNEPVLNELFVPILKIAFKSLSSVNVDSFLSLFHFRRNVLDPVDDINRFLGISIMVGRV